MKEPKVALAMIVAPNDREAELLDRLLSGKVTEYAYPAQKNIDLNGVGPLADAVDGIFITITGDNKKCEEVAKKYGAHISHVKWEYNFAKARNFNFSQVPRDFDYIFWADTDDVVRYPEGLKQLAKEGIENAVDSFILKYLYNHDRYGNCDVEHLKGRLIKNDGCLEWMGEIHEDFKENRKISAFLNEEVELIHLSDPARIDNTMRRNRLVAEMAVKNNPTDPRVYWNLANAYIHAAKYKEAIQIFLQFLEISRSDEERFLAWFRVAASYMTLGQYQFAIEAGLEALALRPWYQDAYLLLGEVFYIIGKPLNAKAFLEIGITQDTPKYKGIVWNPLDYSHKPFLLLGKTYVALNQPKEAVKNYKKALKTRPKTKEIKLIIKRLASEVKKFDRVEKVYEVVKDMKDEKAALAMLDTLPSELRYYPSLVSYRNQRFVKEESSGKDIAIFCGITAIEWDSETFKTKGIGGSEEAVVQLSKRFAKAGYNVTVFNTTPGMQERVLEGVRWIPAIGWNYRDKYDMVIIWRHPKALDLQINSEKIYVDMHDVIEPAEFTTARMKTVTKVFFKSEVQRNYYPDIPDEKAVVIPHGLDVEEFDSQRGDIKRNPFLILNTSSPDRSIKTSMEIIRRVYDRLSLRDRENLKFAHYYGFNVWDTMFENNTQMLAWKESAIAEMNELKRRNIMTDDSGTTLSQKEITKKYLEAGVLLYPSEFFEIGFISGIKGALGGAIPFTTDVFAQGEFLKDGFLVDSDVTYETHARDVRTGQDFGVQSEEQIEKFVVGLVDYIENPEKYELQRNKLIEYARSTFSWDKTAKMWLDEFKK